MLNFKQEELIKQLMENIQSKFPEVKFINVTSSPENPYELWVHVTAPENEEREFELREYTADKSMDILLEYGYHILVMPTPNQESAKLWPSFDLALEEE